MLVKDWMSTEVFTVNVTDTVEEAADVFIRHDISLIPVLNDGKIAGLITHRDLRKVWEYMASWKDVRLAPEELRRQTVDTIMSRSVIAVPPDYTVEETSELLLEQRISGCPVLDCDGSVVGIVTKKDLLKAFTESSGIPGLGILFGFLVQESEDCINDVLHVLRKHDARLVAIMSSYANVPKGYRRIYIRCLHIDRRHIEALRTELEGVAKLLFIVDRKEGTREICTAPGPADCGSSSFEGISERSPHLDNMPPITGPGSELV